MKKYIFCLVAVIAVALSSCANGEELIIYVSIDQPIAQPILEAFEKEYGIRVKPVYDVEAAKTTGLVNRLIAEAANPKADVFWSGEAAQTELLKRREIIGDYISFGGRARILLVNTDLVAAADYPDSIESLLDLKYESVAIANPVFGTSSTHAAALYSVWGETRGRDFFAALQERGAHILDGNSVVRNKVAAGEIAVGLTDTDDAHLSIMEQKPVVVIYPDQKDGEMGAFVIPNTVAIVNGAKNLSNAERFVAYLTSEKVKDSLSDVGWFLPAEQRDSVKKMEMDFVALDQIAEQVKTEMTEMFIR